MPNVLNYIRAFVLTLCICCGGVTNAVVWSEVDTTALDAPDVRPAKPFTIDDLADDDDIFADIYIQPSYDDPIVEVGTKMLYPSYSINPFRKNSVNFTTGEQLYLSLNLDWKWLRVGYSYPLADYTHGYDFSFSPSVANFLIDLGISDIKNYKLHNPNRFFVSPDGESAKQEEEQDVRLEGLETKEWRCSLEWIMNKTYFSASSAFSQSYSCGQRVSAGSMLCGVAFGENRFKVNNAERTEAANEILSHLPMLDNRLQNVSLGCGYGYNFVVRQGVFVVGALLVPYVSGARAHYKLDDLKENHLCFGFRSHGRVNCVYQYRYGFVTLATNWRGIYFNDNYFSYYQNAYSINLSAAFKLGELGIHHEKIPGHRVIDFLGNIF